jgi:two-component system NarL family sensor kinase
MKPLLLFIFAVLSVGKMYGQNSWEHRRDSLLADLAAAKQDSAKAKTMLNIGVLYLDNHQDSADYFAKMLCKFCEKRQLPGMMANGLSMQGYILSCQNKHQEAIALDMQAIAVAQKANLKKALANIYNNTAICYGDMGDKPSALDYYLKASAIYEILDDSSSLAFIYGNISEVYNDLRESNEGYLYALKGISLCRRMHSTHGLGSGMINLGSALIRLGRLDTALVVLFEVREFARKENNKYQQVNVLANIDYAYAGLGRFNLIKANAEEMMAISLSIDNKEGICYALVGLAEYWMHQHKFQLAIHYADSAIAISRAAGLPSVLRDSYQEAGNVEVTAGNIPRYHYYDALRDSVDDALLTAQILKNTQELDAKYSLSKKQAEIDVLNKERVIQKLTVRQQSTVNWALSALILVSAIIGALYIRNYRQKKKLLQADALLQQQRITELEKEKQLLAARAVLQGQVDERTRLSKDLHDGLGSLLSSAKYSFSNMQESLIKSPGSVAAFERSMSMLDKSISELRSIAHNMMPEALVRFGLDTALKDFCNSVDQSGAIQLTYQSFEMDETSIPPLTAGAVYRMIQELVNNILKHAEATKAMVQLFRKGNTLSITVEDNGRGFDPGLLRTIDGTGLLNLKNRVAYLNGTLDIQTAPGKGTSVNIEILNLAI